MPIPLIIALIAAAAGTGALVGVAIAVARITYNLLLGWFQKRNHAVDRNADLVRVSSRVADAIESGSVTRIHTGLWDSANKNFVDSDIYESNRIDPDVAQAHERSEVVIWD